MKLLPEGRSRPLSWTALGSAACCAAMAAAAGRDLATMLELASKPTFYLALAPATVPADMPPLASFLAYRPRTFFTLHLLFWLSGLGLSLGVLARREWARRGTCWLLYLSAAAALLLLFYPWAVVPRPLMFGGVQLAPEFNAVVRRAAYAVRLLAFLVGGLGLWGALLLERGRLKSEFR